MGRTSLGCMNELMNKTANSKERYCSVFNDNIRSYEIVSRHKDNLLHPWATSKRRQSNRPIRESFNQPRCKHDLKVPNVCITPPAHSRTSTERQVACPTWVRGGRYQCCDRFDSDSAASRLEWKTPINFIPLSKNCSWVILQRLNMSFHFFFETTPNHQKSENNVDNDFALND